MTVDIPATNTDPQQLLKGIRCFALDMDGTFYLGDRLLDGSMEFIKKVVETDRKFVFLTNNSSKSKKAYLDKLARMGVAVTPQQLVSSGQATIRYLARQYPGKRVFLLGNQVLREEFEAAGILLDDKHPDMVVTAFDTSLDYQKMCMVCDFVRQGLPYVATHPDFNCPTEDGFIPDIGAIHAFIEASTGRRPQFVVGKPNAEIIDCAMELCGCSPAETAMVGDRLVTDIAVTANVPGLTGILVLSGEAKLADLPAAGVAPHLVFDGLGAIAPLL